MSTTQIAALFKCKRQNINDIFRRHKTEFEEEVDYFFLKKEELYQFKVENGIFSAEDNHAQIPPFSKTANSAFIWTESGIKKFSKFVRTDEADLFFTGEENSYIQFLRKNRVYAMELSEGTVKIGRTCNVDARLKELKWKTLVKFCAYILQILC